MRVIIRERNWNAFKRTSLSIDEDTYFCAYMSEGLQITGKKYAEFQSAVKRSLLVFLSTANPPV